MPVPHSASLPAPPSAPRPCAFPACLLVLLVGAALDAITTMSLMYRFGIRVETHPAMWLMAYLFGITVGVPLGTVIKIGIAVSFAAIWRRWCRWLLLLFGLSYTVGALGNHFLLW